MTIQAYLQILKRHWIAVLCVTFIGLLAAVGLTMTMPQVYISTSTQFVRGVPGTGAGADYQAAQFATSRAKSYSVMIGNPDVLSGIISDLNLSMTPREVYTRLSVENPIDTALINVTARGRSGDEAQAISQAAADNLAKLILRLESAGTASGKSPIDVQTAVPALQPSDPSSPRMSLNVAVGGMLGAALGCIAAVGLDARTARSRRESGRRRASRAKSKSPAEAAVLNRNGG